MTLVKPMNIGIIGARGYVGSRLDRIATQAGHSVVRFSRGGGDGFRRIGPAGPLDFSGLDAVVNLAGEPILGLWTNAKRRAILESRVEITNRVVESLRHDGPRVLVNASAIGFYGDTGEREVDELSPSGTGFLADVCRDWEESAVMAEPLGVRVVRLRIGFVTGPGGALKMIRPVFKAGLGGRLGSGCQWMSCIHVDDVAGMILWALENSAIHGALNAVNPESVRNSDFTRELAAAVRRPALFPVPAFALRILLGDLSHVMLDSVRVRPAIALREGYIYRHPTLSEGLAVRD